MPLTERKIRLLVADDHAIVRQGLCKLLADEPGFEIIGEAVDGRDALVKAADALPDVVLMDLSMPLLHGVEATRQIVKRTPKCRVLILSMHKNEAYVLQALQAGASGYLLKESAPEEVVSAIRAVVSGDTYLSPSISKIVVDDMFGRRRPSGNEVEVRSLYETLTTREREIFQLLAEGMRNLEIAKRLKVSVKTVETHRSHVMEKLALNNVAELVRYAIELGVIHVDQKPLET